MSRLNLKFKNYSTGWKYWAVNHLSMSKLNLKLKIFGEILVCNNKGVNHPSMSRLNLKFKIYSELLASNIGGSIILPC